MTMQETIQMLERMLYPEPWEDYDLSDKAKEALEVAIEALEKRIPKEPTEEPHDSKTVSYNLYCPACGKIIGYRGTITGRIAQKYANKYFCGECSQAIDWGEGGVMGAYDCDNYNDLMARIDEVKKRNKAIHSPTQMSGTSDTISRQAAIDAMKEYEKRVETAEQLWTIMGCKDEILKLPSAQSEIIHCKDCESYQHNFRWCKLHESEWQPNEFCSFAERRTD